MIEIRLLDSNVYKGRKLRFEYVTPGYLELNILDLSFCFEYKGFDEPQSRGFEDELLSDWLEKPILFGAFVDDELAGIIEGSMEQWNKRFRISNLLVFEPYRKQQIASRLLDHMMLEAKQVKARMIILETQSCNIPAIECYRKKDFTSLDSIPMLTQMKILACTK